MALTELVEATRASNWKADGVEQRTTYWVTLVSDVGQREVPCYDARGAELKTDADLPPGWEVKTSKAGKLYLAAPRPTGGGGGGQRQAAWANTEEGERFVQERMDRRTALMQAVTVGSGITTELADKFYSWLRKNLDVSAPRVSRTASPARDLVVEGGRVGADTPLDVSAPGGYGTRETSLKSERARADTPSDEDDGTSYPRSTESGTALSSPSSANVEVGGPHADVQPTRAAEVRTVPGPGAPTSTITHAEKWTPKTCEHQLVPGRPGWLRCTKCGRADKEESEWA